MRNTVACCCSSILFISESFNAWKEEIAQHWRAKSESSWRWHEQQFATATAATNFKIVNVAQQFVRSKYNSHTHKVRIDHENRQRIRKGHQRHSIVNVAPCVKSNLYRYMPRRMHGANDSVRFHRVSSKILGDSIQPGKESSQCFHGWVTTTVDLKNGEKWRFFLLNSLFALQDRLRYQEHAWASSSADASSSDSS